MRSHSRNRFLAASAAMVAMFALSGSVFAQNGKDKGDDANARSVQGSVTDPSDKPVAGAVVQLKDTRTLQIRSFLTKDDGQYHFSGLKTDVDYQVKADHEGLSSSPKTISVFDNRKLATVNLKLEKK